uniref:Uncharacterized protein n=1 Tax=Rhizophora mucronata TaxID=61149 RepID=A0A2P2J6R4_RHIMU
MSSSLGLGRLRDLQRRMRLGVTSLQSRDHRFTSCEQSVCYNRDKACTQTLFQTP